MTDLRPLERLTDLQSLDIERCPELVDLGPLSSLTGLRKLRLSKCAAQTDLTPIANLTPLESLDLSDSLALQDIHQLEALTNLRSLNLSDCNALAECEALRRLTSLQSLLLPGWALRDLTPLQALTELQSLVLKDLRDSPNIEPLTKLTSLEALSLTGNRELTDLIPLQKLVSLQTLDLSGCSALSDLTPLTVLTRLEVLDLTDCVSVTDLTPIHGLKRLKTIDISGSRVTQYPVSFERKITGEAGESDHFTVVGFYISTIDDELNTQQVAARVRELGDRLSKNWSRYEFSIRDDSEEFLFGPTTIKQRFNEFATYLLANGVDDAGCGYCTVEDPSDRYSPQHLDIEEGEFMFEHSFEIRSSYQICIYLNTEVFYSSELERIDLGSPRLGIAGDMNDSDGDYYEFEV